MSFWKPKFSKRPPVEIGIVWLRRLDFFAAAVVSIPASGATKNKLFFNLFSEPSQKVVNTQKQLEKKFADSD